MTEKNNRIFSNKPINIIVGEVTNVVRAQGNPTATGLVIGTGIDSPVVNGQYYSIPQMQVGFMDYEDFKYAAGNFNDAESGIDNTVQHPWNSVGAVGLDALFVPYTTETNSTSAGPFLPHFTSPTGGAETPNVSHLNPFNMFNSLANLQATGNNISNDVWMDSGHNISLALNYNPYDSGVDGTSGMVGASGRYPSGSGGPVDFHFEKDHFARKTVEKEAIRGVGFRGPMILSGPGYDVDGNPVPSSGGQPHPQANWNPALWKTGPVDLRWDASRGVWTGGNTVKIYLVKTTNTYNPSCFSYEVERSSSRSQFTRETLTARSFNATAPIYDPEYVAYTSNANNAGCFEKLNFDGVQYPHYEAFIIRETKDDTSNTSYYNLWTDDCQDCGHVTNSGCGTQHGSSSTGKKILIENPLRQSLNVGDLAFTVKTGRKKQVNTGSFVGGSGVGASGYLQTNANGGMIGVVSASGNGYTSGGFAIAPSGDFCTNISLSFSSGKLSSITVSPTGGYQPNQTYNLNIYPNNSTVETEMLDIHWILQAEFKSQQVTTHVECNGGIMQTCSMKIQTQGFTSCEWCGEDTTLINNFI